MPLIQLMVEAKRKRRRTDTVTSYRKKSIRETYSRNGGKNNDQSRAVFATESESAKSEEDVPSRRQFGESREVCDR